MLGGSRKNPRLAGFQLHHKDPLLADLLSWFLSNRGSVMLLGGVSAAKASGSDINFMPRQDAVYFPSQYLANCPVFYFEAG